MVLFKIIVLLIIETIRRGCAAVFDNIGNFMAAAMTLCMCGGSVLQKISLFIACARRWAAIAGLER